MIKPTIAILLCTTQLCLGQGRQSSPINRPPTKPTSPPALTYAQLISSGYDLLKRARIGEAYLAATRAAEIDPHRFEAYALAALALHVHGADQDAKRFIEKALQLAPPEKRVLLTKIADQITSSLSITSNRAPEATLTQPVSSPPRRKENEPNLEDTMKYIADQLNTVKVSGVLIFKSGNRYDYRYAIPLAQANPKGCTLEWREEYPNSVADWRVLLRDVRVVEVESANDYNRVQGFAYELRPDFDYVHIKMQPGKTAHKRGSEGEADAPQASFSVSDHDLADRLAKAVVHAVELCGGGDNDPFK